MKRAYLKLCREKRRKKNNPVTNGLRLVLSAHAHFFYIQVELLELDGLRIFQEDQLDDFKHEVIITDLSDIDESYLKIL